MASTVSSLRSFILFGLIALNSLAAASKQQVIDAVSELKAACDAGNAELAAPLIIYRGSDAERRYKKPLMAAQADEARQAMQICRRITRGMGELHSYGDVMSREKKGVRWFAIEAGHTFRGREKKATFAFVEVAGKLYLGDID